MYYVYAVTIICAVHVKKIRKHAIRPQEIRMHAISKKKSRVHVEKIQLIAVPTKSRPTSRPSSSVKMKKKNGTVCADAQENAGCLP